jgi:hypothetical protein
MGEGGSRPGEGFDSWFYKDAAPTALRQGGQSSARRKRENRRARIDAPYQVRIPHGQWADVAASRQSAANVDGNSNGGFLPKAATPKQMPQGQRVALARRTKLGDDGNQIAPLPIAASRTVALGGMVATVGFPDIGLQGFAPSEGDG